MKQCRATFFLLNLLVYTELIQQYYAEDCAGSLTNLNVTSDKNLTIQADPRFSYCWKIFAPGDDYRVRLSFSTFVLNKGYDYVEIGDLWDESIRSDSLLAEFSGRVPPKDVISLSRGMWIKFILKVDLDVYHKRQLKFSLIAEIRKVDVKLSCPTPSSHNIIHPFENVNYSVNDYRLWWIKTTPPCTITARPNSLWLEEAYVYLGDSIKGPFRTDTWFNLTGKGEPWYLSLNDYRSEGTDLVVVFTSSFHPPKTGFLFEVFANSIEGEYETHEPGTPLTDSHPTLTGPICGCPCLNLNQANRDCVFESAPPPTTVGDTSPTTTTTSTSYTSTSTFASTSGHLDVNTEVARTLAVGILLAFVTLYGIIITLMYLHIRRSNIALKQSVSDREGQELDPYTSLDATTMEHSAYEDIKATRVMESNLGDADENTESDYELPI